MFSNAECTLAVKIPLQAMRVSSPTAMMGPPRNLPWQGFLQEETPWLLAMPVWPSTYNSFKTSELPLFLLFGNNFKLNSFILDFFNFYSSHEIGHNPPCSHDLFSFSYVLCFSLHTITWPREVIIVLWSFQLGSYNSTDTSQPLFFISTSLPSSPSSVSGPLCHLVRSLQTEHYSTEDTLYQYLTPEGKLYPSL